MSEDRHNRGLALLRRIHGARGEEVIADLEALAPDFARFIVDFAFGDVYSRPALDLKIRQIVTVAALTALGNARNPLKWHMHGALNVGCTREELLEVVIQVAVYGGFPAASNALAVAREVFEERADQSRPRA